MTRMPSLFVGHGSPMNALIAGPWPTALAAKAQSMPRPKSILVISAHWISPDLRVSSAAEPRQVYDFFGFPEDLYKIEYKSPGDPELALRAGKVLSQSGFPCRQDQVRGIDHAAWAVLLHMYPESDIPVVEMSLDYSLKYRQWFDVGRALAPLRDEGVLIVGSGNIVHNLYRFDYEMNIPPYDWAITFNTLVKDAIERKDWGTLASYAIPVDASRESVPGPDHYLPLLAVLGTMQDGERASVFHESFQNGSVAMTSFAIE